MWARMGSWGAPKPKVLVELKDLTRWPAYFNGTVKTSEDYTVAPDTFWKLYKYQPNAAINEKIILWKGDITCLKIDGIVNAANDGLWAGGGICGAIHSAAGPELERECEQKFPNGCETGNTAVTRGFKLPSKFVFHAVGPTNGSAPMLQSCYTTCLEGMVKHDVRSLAFCCIATGIFGFPNDAAAVIALRTVRDWLDKPENAAKVDAIIFCLFLPRDVDLYHSFAPVFFPVADAHTAAVADGKAAEGAAAPASAAPAAAAAGGAAAAAGAGAGASASTVPAVGAAAAAGGTAAASSNANAAPAPAAAAVAAAAIVPAATAAPAPVATPVSAAAVASAAVPHASDA